MIVDSLLNISALSASLGAIWLTANPKTDGHRRLGCLIGMVACVLNFSLQVAQGAPWSTWALSIIAFLIYGKSFGLPTFIKKLWSH